MADYTAIGDNPIIATDIMNALGVDGNHLQIASVYNRVKGIVNYFSKFPNPRKEVLNVIAKKSGNPIDVAWTYAQLQQEKEALLAKLPPEEFEPDIADEIVSGHLTITKKQRIRDDIKKRTEAQQKEKQKAEQLANEAEKNKVLESLTDNKLDFYGQVLDELDSYDKQLSFYT